jgi:hypothetical protein
MGRHTLRTPALLPVIERGRPVVGAERDRVGVLILAAADAGESTASIARRMGRSWDWVAGILYDLGYVNPRSQFRGPARIATGFHMSGEYHRGASAAELAVKWGLKRTETVERLLAEWECSVRERPRPSEAWRRAHLPVELLPEDLTAEPTPEEWVHIWTYLTEQREAGALLTELVAETGLCYGTVQHGLSALKVQADRTQSST